MSKTIKVKATLRKQAELEIAYVHVRVPYDEDDEIPNGLDADEGILCFAIEAATGKVEDWPADNGAFHLQLKPRDAGVYKILGPTGDLIAEIDESYVPNGIIPGDYGDYIDLKIDEHGVVTNWKPDWPDSLANEGWQSRDYRFVGEE